MAEIEGQAGLDYVGRKKCGCVTLWISHEAAAAVKAKEIAAAVRKGYEIERRSTEWARENVRSCRCEPELPF